MNSVAAKNAGVAEITFLLSNVINIYLTWFGYLYEQTKIYIENNSQHLLMYCFIQ